MQRFNDSEQGYKFLKENAGLIKVCFQTAGSAAYSDYR
jgi:hypothetical protein